MSWIPSGLIIFFLCVGAAPIFAENGVNYDRELISVNQDGSLIWSWTSVPPRIWDGSQWVNYVYSETDDYIRFESKSISFEFYKNSCDFKLYKPDLIGRKTPMIDSFSHSLSIDNTPEILPQCNTMMNTNQDGIQIIAQRGFFKTTYDLNYAHGLEWTHEIDNTKGRDINVLITDICNNCQSEKISDEIIRLNDYLLDTKNYVHNTVSDTRAENQNYLIEYSSVINDRGLLVIDPTFSYTSADIQYVDTGNQAGGTTCLAVTPGNGTGAGLLYPWEGNSGGGANTNCRFVIAQWDLSSIPDVYDVSDVKLRIDTGAVGGGVQETCDIAESTRRLDVDTVTNLINDIANSVGTTYVDNDSTLCTTSGASNYVVSLPTSAEQDLKDNVNGSPAYSTMNNAFGVTFANDGLVRGVSHYGYDFTDIELSFTYEEAKPPNMDITQDIHAVGDVFEITGTVQMLEAGPQANITDIVIRINGTIIDTNSTNHNQTAPFTIKYGPIYSVIPDGDIRNITTTVAAQQTFNDYLNETKTYTVWDYGPDYFSSVVASQGDVNYTYINNLFKVNRDLGTSFQIECFVQDWSNTFFATNEGTWYNKTGVWFFEQTLPPTSDYYATCYNDDLLFLAAPLYSNFTNMMVPALFIFDALGGFIGMPAVLLFVLAIFSWGTGRNFPIVLVIGLGALGVLGAMGLYTMSGELWGVVFVLGGIGVFGIRKFF